ncbi:MAG: hypothetical protein QXV17_13890 [Candidatus Micrarchaeaceae archaeon]
MNESMSDTIMKRGERKLKFSESIIEEVNKYPEGTTFSELRQNLKIPDSTLSRSLERLCRDQTIFKSNGKYYPSSGNFAIPTFSIAMEAVKGLLYKRIPSDLQENVLKARISLSEILGSPGYAAPYPYSAIADDGDILDFVRLLKRISEFPDLKNFEFSLAQFIRIWVSIKKKKGEVPRKPIVKELEEAEKETFEKIKNNIFDKEFVWRIQDEAWYELYEALSECESGRVAGIFDDLMMDLKMEWNNSDLKAKIEVLNNLFFTKLWNPSWCKVIYFRQAELFQDQLKYSAKKPELSLFIQNLRSMAIKDYKE